MRSTSLFVTCSAAALLSTVLAGRADADASHQILSQSPIKQRGKIVGFRATVLLDPQNQTVMHPSAGGDVRLGLGGMKYNFVLLDNHNPNQHRDAVAGVLPGYVNHQFKMREITGPNATDRGPLTETIHTGGQPKEVEVEVLYKENPGIIPGKKLDLVAGFWKGSYWHVWGAADSPTHSSTDFIVEMPGKATTHTLQRALAHLTAEEARAKAEVAAVTARSTADIAAATRVKQDADAAATAAKTAAIGLQYGTPQQQAAQAARTQANVALQAANAELMRVQNAVSAANGQVTVIAARRAELTLELEQMQAARTTGKAPVQPVAAAAPPAPAATP